MENKELNLAQFFANEKSQIVMFFQEESVTKILPSIKNPKDWLYWTHFIKYDEISKESSFLRLSQETVFKKNEKILDFTGAHKVIMKSFDRWRDFSSLPFPDVILSKTKGASYTIVENTPGVVKLSLEELEDLDRLAFVLAHELGHYYYIKNLEQQELKEINKRSYFKENPWMALAAFLVLLGASASMISLFRDKSLSLPMAAVMIVLQCFSMAYIAYLELPHWLSFKNRLWSYSREFYADHFAQWFVDREIKSSETSLLGGDQDFNLYSHPGGRYRMNNLKSNYGASSLVQWKNPVFETPQFFSRASFYEVQVYWPNLIKSLYSKTKVFMKKALDFTLLLFGRWPKN